MKLPEKMPAFVISGLRGAHSSLYRRVLSRRCAPGAPNLTALGDFLRQLP
jgi:hypothetical protein